MISVEPLTRAWGEALSLGEKTFSERFGIPVVEGWAVFPEALPGVLGAAPESGDRWGTHLSFDDDGALVGWGGWKGAPVGGVSELGYAVAPSRRGRGIATHVVRLLISQARDAGVRLVIAHTLPEESASTGVLRRSGFVRTAQVVDPDGETAVEVWRWELDPAGFG
jgi:RimJ/RimL family protein N-acetyltransferase